MHNMSLFTYSYMLYASIAQIHISLQVKRHWARSRGRFVWHGRTVSPLCLALATDLLPYMHHICMHSMHKVISVV